MRSHPESPRVARAPRARRRAPTQARLRIGAVQLGKLPRVVLAVRQDSASLRAAVRQGVDIIELRVDQLGSEEPATAVKRLKSIRRYGLPIIGTVRSPHEGGAGTTLTDAQRTALYGAIAPLVDAIDVEIRSARALAEVLRAVRANRNVLILSYHDFFKTPSLAALVALAERATALGADIIKLAVQVRAPEDLLRVFEFTAQQRSRNLVVIAMGAMGSVSRLLLPLAGSLLTYTNLTPSLGQIPLERLMADLRFYYPNYDAEKRKAERAKLTRGRSA